MTTWFAPQVKLNLSQGQLFDRALTSYSVAAPYLNKGAAVEPRQLQNNHIHFCISAERSTFPRFGSSRWTVAHQTSLPSPGSTTETAQLAVGKTNGNILYV